MQRDLTLRNWNQSLPSGLIVAGAGITAIALAADYLGVGGPTGFGPRQFALALIGIAVAPTAAVAIALLFARQLLSQIDVPTRQAWVMSVVPDDEREAAATTTTLWRTAAQAVTPFATGWIMQSIALSAPFVLGGALKILYDLLLWKTFKDLEPHE